MTKAGCGLAPPQRNDDSPKNKYTQQTNLYALIPCRPSDLPPHYIPNLESHQQQDSVCDWRLKRERTKIRNTSFVLRRKQLLSSSRHVYLCAERSYSRFYLPRYNMSDAYERERQNNSRLSELSAKVTALRGVTVDIYDNARAQDVIDNTVCSFSLD